MAKTWEKVKDTDVLIVWECKDCDNQHSVNPSWHQDNGTPVCDKCDRDMTYAYTEIRKKI